MVFWRRTFTGQNVSGSEHLYLTQGALGAATAVYGSSFRFNVELNVELCESAGSSLLVKFIIDIIINIRDVKLEARMRRNSG